MGCAKSSRAFRKEMETAAMQANPTLALSKHAQNIFGNATSNRTSFKKSVYGNLTNSTNRAIIFGGLRKSE